MSQSSNVLSDIIAAASRSGESSEVLSRWQAVLSEAEIAARRMSHGDSEETDIASYVQKWGAAIVSPQCNTWISSETDSTQKAITTLMSDFRHQGFPTPVIPEELAGLFKGAMAFYNAHLPTDTPTTDIETAQPSRVPPTVHKDGQCPTTQPDNAPGPSTEDKATMPQPPKVSHSFVTKCILKKAYLHNSLQNLLNQ